MGFRNISFISRNIKSERARHFPVNIEIISQKENGKGRNKTRILTKISNLEKPLEKEPIEYNSRATGQI